jgi:3-deoxy-7-phosphoheptulonate synthase
MAAVAVGADGLMIEVHPSPEQALSDGAQSLTLEMFAEMMRKIRPLVDIMERKL